ncbi:DUF2627 domain-containing protein [Bacillaceae bacterium SIJ1]|nr:DUF2627 domain-containing protein [Litoribacterium kuwaitense]
MLILIPIASAAYGIKLLRDVLFASLQFPYPYLWMQFFAGLFFLGVGLYLIGGFVVFRDRKNGKIPARRTKNKRTTQKTEGMIPSVFLMRSFHWLKHYSIAYSRILPKIFII